MKIKTASDLIYWHNELNPDSYYFSKSRMKYFGDSVTNYYVPISDGEAKVFKIKTLSGDVVNAYRLDRKKPVKHGYQSSSFFNVNGLGKVIFETYVDPSISKEVSVMAGNHKLGEVNILDSLYNEQADKDDPWGSIMNWSYNLCDYMLDKGMTTPESMEYEPSPMGFDYSDWYALDCEHIKNLSEDEFFEHAERCSKLISYLKGTEYAY